MLSENTTNTTKNMEILARLSLRGVFFVIQESISYNFLADF